MYRLIYSLALWFDTTPAGGSSMILVNLDRQGNSELPNGPRPRRKPRVVDLRTGDEVLVLDQWKTIEKIEMWCERLLTEEQALDHRRTGDRGWIVKAPEGYVSPLTGGSVRRDD